jgi:hypothetical protein
MLKRLSLMALVAAFAVALTAAPASAHGLPVKKAKRAVLKQAKHDAEVTRNERYGVTDCERLSRHAVRCLGYNYTEGGSECGAYYTAFYRNHAAAKVKVKQSSEYKCV